MVVLNVSLDAFEGPLDLLLHLIAKHEIDIYDIPVAKLTDQYMAYVRVFSTKDMERLSAFLVMAATLLEIKSKMLLPASPPDTETEAEDPRAELVQRLVEYKQYKGVLDTLREKQAEAARIFTRAPDKALATAMHTHASFELGDLLDGMTLGKLLAVFDETLRRKALKTDVVRSGFKSISKDIFTVEDKMGYILDYLILHEKITFRSLFSSEPLHKAEIVVTFLAVLELVKLKKIIVQQNRLFDEIGIVSGVVNSIEQGEK